VKYIDPIGLISTLSESNDGTPPGCSGGPAGSALPIFNPLGNDANGLRDVEWLYDPAVTPNGNQNNLLSTLAPLSPQRTNLYLHPNPMVAHDPRGLHPELWPWALREQGIDPTPEQWRELEEWWHDFIGEPLPSQTNPQPTNYGDTSKLWPWALSQCGIGPTAAQKQELEDWWKDWVDQSLAKAGKKKP
jgi:hypothetical protein